MTFFGDYVTQKYFSACPLLTQEIIKEKKGGNKRIKLDSTFFHMYRGNKHKRIPRGKK